MISGWVIITASVLMKNGGLSALPKFGLGSFYTKYKKYARSALPVQKVKYIHYEILQTGRLFIVCPTSSRADCRLGRRFCHDFTITPY